MKSRNSKQLLKEVAILKKLKHDHIIRYFHSFVDHEAFYILMEFAEGGDIHNVSILDLKLMRRYWKEKKHIPEKEVWWLAYEIALGLEYLHRSSIVHWDLKNLNILLTKDLSVKVSLVYL